MEKDLFNALAKRLLFLTKIIFSLLVIGIILFINYLDLQEKNRDSRYLNFLANVYEKGDQELSFENFELERVSYLETQNQVLSKRHINARNKIVGTLNRYGATIDRAGKGEGNSVNYFVLMSNDLLGVKDQQQSNVKTLGEPGTVDSAIAMFKRYSQPEKVYLITGIDTVLFHKLDSAQQKTNQVNETEDHDSNLQSPNSLNVPLEEEEILFSRSRQFKGAYIRRSSLVISFGERSSVGQAAPRNWKITVPAEIDSTEFPSSLFFAVVDTVILRKLENNTAELNRLGNIYGYYQLSMVHSMSTDALLKNSTAVSILGFDLSRKWFPLAMSVVLVVLYYLTYVTVNQATGFNYKIISNSNTDDVLEIILENKIIRFFLWVITPVLISTLVLYSTLIYYSYVIYGLVILCTVFCLILGIITYRLSLRL